MPQEEAVACLRCGDFVAPGSLRVAGLAFCARCLEGERTEADPVWARPPRAILWKRIRILLPMLLVGFVAGAFVGWTRVVPDVLATATPRPPVSPWIVVAALLSLSGVIGMLIAFLPAAVYSTVRLTFLGAAEWKRDLRRELALERVPDVSTTLVLYLSRRVPFGEARLPAEFGLLVEGERGFLFFGAKGSRIAWPLEGLEGAALETLWGIFPPQSWLRLDLAGGTCLFLSSREERTYRANRHRFLALAARIRERLARPAS